MKPHLFFFLLPPILLAGCKGPRDLQTKVNNRPIDTLTASAQMENDLWVVEMNLPAGNWTIKTEEDQPFEIIKGDPKSTLRWKVSPGRWSNKEKPFNFQISPDSGQPLYCSVKYVSTPGVTGTVIYLMCELLKFRGLIKGV